MLRILIIDDSAVMRRIHKNTLIENNIPETCLLEASDGQEALTAAKNEQISLFLVDWNMPRLDGFEFVKNIRAMEQYSKTPIIMVTSEAARQNVMQAINAGVTNYLVKPVKGDLFWQKVSPYIQ